MWRRENKCVSMAVKNYPKKKGRRRKGYEWRKEGKGGKEDKAWGMEK